MIVANYYQFVPFSTLKGLGFTSRRNAREKYYRRAKVTLFALKVWILSLTSL